MASSNTSSPTTTYALVGIMLMVLAGFIIYQFQSAPLKAAHEKYEAARALSAAKERDVEALTSAASQLQDKEAMLATYGVSRDSISAVMPATEEAPSLYLQMEALMQQAADVEAPTYSIGKPVVETNIPKIPVTVTATGKYGALKTLLTTIQTVTRPVTVTTLNFAPAAGENGTERPDQFTMTATGYFTSVALSPSYTDPEQVPAN